MSTENTVTTVKGREKFAKAHAGLIVLPPITQIGFGNGGIDATGIPTMPDDTSIEVSGEFLKKDIESASFLAPAVNAVIGILDFAEGNGEDVSAVGLYDAENDLVAMKHFAAKPKDSETRIEINWNEKF